MRYPHIQSLLESQPEALPTRSVSVSREKAIAWMEQHAPIQWAKALASDIGEDGYISTPIYRGVRDRDAAPYSTVDPTKSLRTSKSDADLYRVLLDAAHPDWPQRGYSVIGATDHRIASVYGTAHHMFAPDDAMIVDLGADDIWTTGMQDISAMAIRIKERATQIAYNRIKAVENQGVDGAELADSIEEAMDEMILVAAPLAHSNAGVGTKTAHPLTSLDDWRKGFVSFHKELHILMKLIPGGMDALIHWIDNDTAHGVFAQWLQHSSFDLIGALLRVAKSAYDGARLVVASEFVASEYYASEVWVEAECLLIDRDEMVGILQGRRTNP